MSCNPYIFPGVNPAVGVKTILNVVSDAFEIPINDILLRTRKRAIVEPRQLAMTLLLLLNKEKSVGVGRRFGKNHATVLHARKTVAYLYETNKPFREKVEHVLTEIGLKEDKRNDFLCSLLNVDDLGKMKGAKAVKN